MKKVVVQGLGYVGLAMLTFCAGAKKKNKYLFNVVGVEKNSSRGSKIIEAINSKQVPSIVDDKKFLNFYKSLVKENRIKASLDSNEYANADIVFVCSNCDSNFTKRKVELKKYLNNIFQISNKIFNNSYKVSLLKSILYM